MNNRSFILHLALEGDGNTMKKAPVSKMASGIYIVIPVALLAIIGIFIYLAYLHRKRNCYLDFHLVENKSYLNLNLLNNITLDLIHRRGKKNVDATVRNSWAYG